MKVFPFDDINAALMKLVDYGINFQQFIFFFQQFNCAKCGVKQTMDSPNTLFTTGKCQECGHVSDLRKDGCNYMIVQKSVPEAAARGRKDVH